MAYNNNERIDNELLQKNVNDFHLNQPNHSNFFDATRKLNYRFDVKKSAKCTMYMKPWKCRRKKKNAQIK